jgi:hypothetical protein
MTSHGLDEYLHRRVTIARHILNAGTQVVTVTEPNHHAIITNPKKNLATMTVRKGNQFPDQRSRERLLVLQHGAFTFV